MWTLGFIIMISANLGTGFCKNPIPFDICRALAGVGSAMSCELLSSRQQGIQWPLDKVPNALAILGRTYPPGKIRNITFAILGALAPAGYCIGGGVASLFAQFVDVRWIWWFVWVNFPRGRIPDLWSNSRKCNIHSGFPRHRIVHSPSWWKSTLSVWTPLWRTRCSTTCACSGVI